MPDTVLNALQNKLARYEAEGNADRVKQIKARIARLEKAEKEPAPELPMALNPTPQEPPAVLGATVTKKGEPSPPAEAGEPEPKSAPAKASSKVSKLGSTAKKASKK